MPPCPMSNGSGFRGPPVPLLLVPVVIHLVRTSADPKMTTYLKDVARGGGPAAIAENAHKIAQYALSRVPSNVLYWFASRVLNLPPEVAMQTTEFLRSGGELLESPLAEQQQQQQEEEEAPLRLEGTASGGPYSAGCLPLEIERRLERLELDYRLLLQGRQDDPSRMLTYPPQTSRIPRELPLPREPVAAMKRIGMGVDDSKQLVQITESEVASNPFTADGQGVLQDVGIRLGRIFLEWAGDTMKQSLVSAAARSMGNQAFLGAGVDLAGRLVDAVVT